LLTPQRLARASGGKLTVMLWFTACDKRGGDGTIPVL
jgi:hypothetical protein